jgi:hypothetical protein
LVLATTGVSSDRPAVTSTRPLSVRPVLTARRDAIVSDGVHEVAVAIRTYSRDGYGKRIGASVHFQRDLRIGKQCGVSRIPLSAPTADEVIQ